VNLPALEGVALRKVFGRLIRKPLYLEEASQAKALAEKWFGLACDVPSFVCVDLGVGIGAGLVQDRRLYAPGGGYAGEIGHVIVEPGGPLCRCGHRGCLEACISERVLLERINGLAGRAYQRLDEIRDVGGAAGDVLQEAGYRLGVALAYLANIMCPPLIILNGPLMRFADLVLPEVERGLDDGALADCRARVRLAVSTLPEAGACGAAARALAELYEVTGHVQV
jgi:predicted NBD/HSP70 family sugar kinase